MTELPTTDPIEQEVEMWAITRVTTSLALDPETMQMVSTGTTKDAWPIPAEIAYEILKHGNKPAQANLKVVPEPVPREYQPHPVEGDTTTRDRMNFGKIVTAHREIAKDWTSWAYTENIPTSITKMTSEQLAASIAWCLARLTPAQIADLDLAVETDVPDIPKDFEETADVQP